MKARTKFFSLIAVFLLFSLISCKNTDDDSSGKSDSYKKVKVAVVLPLSEGSMQAKRFRRVSEWFISTLERATSVYSTPFTLDIEWYDENGLVWSTADGEPENTEGSGAALAKRLAVRDDLLAIVGPMYSSHVQIFADYCYETKKTLIAPTASSESVIRAYAVNAASKNMKSPFLWTLTESDVSQIEALLAKVKVYGGQSVSLLASADIYGKTFFDWVGFLALELGLELKQNVIYETDKVKKEYESGTQPLSLADATEKVLSSDADFVLCAFSSYEDAEEVLKQRAEAGDSAPRLLFTDTSFSAELLSFTDGEDCLAEGIEGTAPYADPESAFSVEYVARFGEKPVLGEAQFYDSLLLCSFAAAGCFRNESGGDADAFANEKVNEELRKMNAATSGSEYAWNLVGMIVALKSLDREIYTNLCGATGLLDFDSETLTSALYSVYVHWGVVEGKFVPLEFTSTDGSSHSSENRASWEWIASFDDNEDIMESENSSVTYDEPASDQWAVIVAASTGWANYRHQADALHFYQLLRKNHFPDDHIILIIADDIANYKRNKHPGEIFARLDGENLYTDDLEIDYLLEELTVEELSEIMQGKSIELPERENLCSQHLKLVDSPTILESRDSSNIIWFWSGHGTNVNGDSENGYFVWEGKPSEKGYRGFTTGLMSETLEAMDSDEEGNKHFRQLLILTETCYSGSVMHICDGIEGVLAFTAANGSETSLADLYSVELKVWLSNRFTKNLTDKISETPGIFYADLYKYLTRNTIGSHVRLFNGLKFGNLYENSPKELVVYAEE